MCNFLVKMCTIRVKGVWFLARSSFFGFLSFRSFGRFRRSRKPSIRIIGSVGRKISPDPKTQNCP